MDNLLVIDLQKEFKDSNGQYENVLRFINENSDKYHIIATIFKNKKESMYTKHLSWSGCMESDDSSLEYTPDVILNKTRYSVDTKLLDKNSLYYIVGCDADACVLATAYALWDSGIEFKVLTEYIYTTSTDIGKNDIIKIMKRNFGDCVL